jgi:NAD(P)-dependent dehydrogenase (short-subunit alcohol dehydrogenase family)
VVTGASKGIGLAITRALVQEGVNVIAGARDTTDELTALTDGGRGQLDILINNVGAVTPRLNGFDPSVIDYSAAKAALRNFCKSLSKEVGPKGIRVNTISPGPVATDLWLGEHGVAATVARASGGDPEAVAAHAAADSVTGRFTRPDEIADLVLFLASERATNITGADFTIDGGLITTI